MKDSDVGARRDMVSAFGPPVILILIVVFLWELAARILAIPQFILPAPTDVLASASENFERLANASLLTAAAAISGFFLSFTFGCVIAFFFSQSVMVRRSLYPYAIFLQTVPIVAIAPLIIIWFGTGFQSVVVVSFILGLFPIITNVTTGLLAIDEDLLELFSLYDAGRWKTLLNLRIPHSIPYLVSGAKISSGLSVIGAVVGEFFAGYGTDSYGLGYLVIQSSGQLKTPLLFAAILLSALLGLLIFGAVALIGSRIAGHSDTGHSSG